MHTHGAFYLPFKQGEGASKKRFLLFVFYKSLLSSGWKSTFASFETCFVG